MRALSRLCRLLAGGMFFLGIALPLAGQEEKPVDPRSLDSESLARFPLQINGFAVGSYTYRFPTNENTFETSALALSLPSHLAPSFLFWAARGPPGV